jgi:uncharacterized short protein YbdD (DUF466 family)
MIPKFKKKQNLDRIKEILINYALVNWDEPNKNLTLLQKYITQIESMEIGIDELNGYVETTKNQIDDPLELSKSRAILFTEDKKIRIIKFGSDNCPNCDKYKNNERECQHCGFFELILFNN